MIWSLCTGRREGERGIALVIVLFIVALLTIVVTEFTYSVQLSQHRARNSIHALQSNLLARSGVNLAEGFLMLDVDPAFDAFTEDWWLELEEFCLGLELGPGMRVKCRVRDESGKINVNMTRGRRRQLEDQPVTRDAVLRDAMRRMFESHNLDVQIVDELAEYWLQEPEEQPDGGRSRVPDFMSLEDFAAIFGIPNEELRSIRKLLTAQPRRLQPAININTASAEVLTAVLNDGEAVDAILTRQLEDDPFTDRGQINQVMEGVEHANVLRGVFDVRSRLYRIEASALTNVDPDGLGIDGIGQTLSVLVWRRRDNRRQRDDGAPGWTVRPLAWDREGGARLFWPAEADEGLSETQDESDSIDAREYR